MKDLTDADIERAQSAMQRAHETYTGEIDREERKLFSGAGMPLFEPAEMQQRQQSIRAAAAATRGAVLERYETEANEIIDEAERQMVLLDADPLALLGAEDATRAAARQLFAREDAELPTYQLAPRVDAIVAAGDKIEGLLLSRYLRRRLDSEPAGPQRQGINALVEKLRPLVDDPDRAKKRAAADALKERGRKLRFAVWGVTRAEKVEQEKERMRPSWAGSI